MKILKILGVVFVLAIGAFIGYINFYQKEIVVVDGVKANKAVNLKNDVVVMQELPQSDIELKEIQIQFGTYSAQKKTEGGVLTVSLLENGEIVQQWFLQVEKLVDNAYQSFVLDKEKKLNPESNYTIKVSYHYTGDNIIAIWTNNDAKYGSFKNGEQALDGSVCYKLVYLKEKQ